MKRVTIISILCCLVNMIYAQGITSGKEVDLGLPSGTIWSGWNLGAASPEQCGCYYAWGELQEKKNYNLDSYEHFDSFVGYVNIGNDISNSKFDVVRQKWGNGWRIPTASEFYELIEICRWEWITYRGVTGYKVIGPNGKSIFFPATGIRVASTLEGKGVAGCYRTSTSKGENRECAVRFLLERAEEGYETSAYYVYAGMTIRPVR